MSAASCLACRADRFDDLGNGWQRCRSCRSWRRTTMPSPDELADIHQAVYFAPSARVEMTDDALLAQYVDIMDEHARIQGRRIVDIGAGGGDAAGLVDDAGGTYVAVENNADARSRLEAAGISAFETIAEAAGDEPFDAGLAIEVVEHLLDPRSFLRDVRAGLRQDAPLLITTPNAASLHGRLKGGRWWAAALPAHVSLYTAQGLAILLRDCGFAPGRRCRFVDYGHGRVHQGAQRLLQVVGRDGGLRMIAHAA